jgi:dTDP-4-amino-4,6-dideoxygalactose transaminase
VIAVHLYGQPADLDPILAFANQRGIRVIEDAAQAHGAKYKARRIGSHSDAVAWSFYPGKNLGALGDGGAVTTSNDEVAASVRRLRNYGSDEKYVHKVCGYNSRLDPIQAAILSVKLSALEEWNRRRERIARLYLEQLDSTQLVLPKVADFAESVWHLFVVRHPRRDALQAALTQHGVQTLIHYPIAPHAQEAYRTLNLHNELADHLASTVLSLPMDPIMPMNEVAQVIEVVNRCVNEV